MGIAEEIENFEFQSLSPAAAEKIKAGFIECSFLYSEEESKDSWIDNAGCFEEILENDPSQPETLREILEFLQPFEYVATGETLNIFKVKKFDEFESYKDIDPLLISVIEVLYENIDERFELESFLEELIDLCGTISKYYD